MGRPNRTRLALPGESTPLSERCGFLFVSAVKAPRDGRLLNSNEEST